MTAARPGQFTGATDNPASGGLFTDTLIDGIPDLVGADVLAAQTAATNAATSETNAATSETNAATSATSAATSATAASTSATEAATSATEAATSATNAAADVASIAGAVDSAATSATNAAASETAAAGSATSAATSATSATTQANTAVTSASAASNSATAAATSATNSANSATASASSATSAATSATNASNSASAAATSATSAANAQTAAETAETNAETAETNAASSASAAATSATNAATSATNAATSATSAGNSATAAATSATNASTSATAAAASEAAAAGYVDNFDDKYLGAKTSDPTVDNDGDPLTDGALYYNTTDNRMKVYDLGTTTWLFLAPTNAEQTNINTVANDITNVNTVATNITDVNNFADTYFISATAPGSPTEGDLWFDTSTDTMKVYNGGSWQNAGSSVNGTSQRYNYTVGTASGTYTGSTTVFPAIYDVGFVDVYLNGIKLVVSDDFTATNGSSIVLATAASSGDSVNIIGYGTFSLANVDAVTLDGIDSTQFLRSDVATTATGITVTGTVAAEVLSLNGSANTLLQLESTDSFAGLSMADTTGSVVMQTANGYVRFLTGGDASTAGVNAAEAMRIDSSGKVTINKTAVAGSQTASITGSTTLDFGTYQNFILTLTGNITLDNPTTEQVGQSGFITFIQTGGYTVSLGTDYETAGGAGITLSASGTDVVPYIVAASGRILLGAPQLAFA